MIELNRKSRWLHNSSTCNPRYNFLPFAHVLGCSSEAPSTICNAPWQSLSSACIFKAYVIIGVTAMGEPAFIGCWQFSFLLFCCGGTMCGAIRVDVYIFNWRCFPSKQTTVHAGELIYTAKN